MDFDRVMSALANANLERNSWTIDLCFWKDAPAVTGRCKQYVDQLNAQYGGIKYKAPVEIDGT